MSQASLHRGSLRQVRHADRRDCRCRSRCQDLVEAHGSPRCIAFCPRGELTAPAECCQANPPRVNGRDPKSFAEQVNEKFLLAREDKLCSKEAVSILEAWNRRQAPDMSLLAPRTHRCFPGGASKLKMCRACGQQATKASEARIDECCRVSRLFARTVKCAALAKDM